MFYSSDQQRNDVLQYLQKLPEPVGKYNKLYGHYNIYLDLYFISA